MTMVIIMGTIIVDGHSDLGAATGEANLIDLKRASGRPRP